MKEFWNLRPGYWRSHVQAKYNLAGSFELHFNYTAQTPGKVTVNSNKIPIPFGYTGTYFKNVPIEVTATPNPGHTFSHWLETGETTPTIFFATGASAATLTPVFDFSGQPVPQTITFPAIADKPANTPPFPITATASSGLPVSFAIVSGPATVSGNVVSLTGSTGSVTVRASQAGNALYQPAPTVDRTFNVLPATLLSQTITFPAIPNKLTTSAPFGVTATASSGLPVTFSIVSGPATVSGSTITLTGQAGTVVVQASQGGNAQYLAAPNVQQSFTVSPPSGTNYCASTSTYPWHEWVSKVQLGSINNTSGKTKYSNFTAISTNLVRGSSYPVALTATFSYATYGEYFRVWIDFNGDAQFEDTEIAYQGVLPAPPSGTSATGTLNGTIAVPFDATLGTTRMRVAMKRGAYATACETFTNGEVEDYSVNISLTAIQGPGQGNDVATGLVLDASLEQEHSVLLWGDEGNAAVAAYVLEKSTDGLNFEPLMDLGRADHHGKQLDEAPAEGVNFYRLKALLQDGSLHYSPVAQLAFEQLPGAQAYPNPASNEVRVRLNFYEGKDIVLRAYNDLGHVVFLDEIACCNGTADYRIDTSKWRSGVYTLVIDSEEVRRKALKVVVMK
jgi:hypothetical protein